MKRAYIWIFAATLLAGACGELLVGQRIWIGTAKADSTPPSATGSSLGGQVLGLDGTPIAGVTLQIGTISTQSNGSGRFLLTGLTPGQQVLWIEGATADTVTNTYGEFEVSVTLSAGFNPLPYTIWMPALDTADAVSIPSPTTSDMVITNPQLPGLELHIPAGTVITDHYGNVVTSVSISPVPIAQPPFPLPSGVRVPLYFTIQPGGAYLTSAGGTPTGAQLYYPNSDQMPPGSRYNFWNYDADPGRLRLVRLW